MKISKLSLSVCPYMCPVIDLQLVLGEGGHIPLTYCLALSSGPSGSKVNKADAEDEWMFNLSTACTYKHPDSRPYDGKKVACVYYYLSLSEHFQRILLHETLDNIKASICRSHLTGLYLKVATCIKRINTCQISSKRRLGLLDERVCRQESFHS